jgi:microcystin-dependent protein
MILSKHIKLAALLGAASLAWSSPASAEYFIGEMIIAGNNYCPKFFTTAAGQLLPINQNQALFSLLGTSFGGDGVTNFALPDLRGRVVVGEGSYVRTFSLGEIGGRDSTTVTVNQLPAHSHAVSLKTFSTASNSNSPANNHVGRATTNDYSNVANPQSALAAGSMTVGNSGGGQPLPISQPALTIQWCISLSGVFPSRN